MTMLCLRMTWTSAPFSRRPKDAIRAWCSENGERRSRSDAGTCCARLAASREGSRAGRVSHDRARPSSSSTVAADARVAAVARRLDQELRRPAPKEGGGDNVGVKDGAHGLREARRALLLVPIRVPLR